MFSLVPRPQSIVFGGGYVKTDGFDYSALYQNAYINGIKDFLKKGTYKLRCIYDEKIADEGYRLETDGSEARIYFSHDSGAFYACVTLMQLCKEFKDALPLVAVTDFPVSAHRGAQVSLAQVRVETKIDYLKSFIKTMAAFKINTLYLYIETYFKFPSFEHFAGDGAMTPQQAEELQAFAADYNITVVPQINLLGHAADIIAAQKYSHLAEYDEKTEDPRTIIGSEALCATSREVEKFADGIIDDTLKIFKSKIIHVGGDEVAALGICPKCRESAGEDKFELYIKYFSRIKKRLNDNGRIMGIWGDMLVHNVFEKSPESLPKSLEEFRDGCIIYDWHYETGSAKTIEFFMKNGFTVITATSAAGCESSSVPIPRRRPIEHFLMQGQAAGVYGALVTDWINYLCYHVEQAQIMVAIGEQIMWNGKPQNGLELDFTLQKYGARSKAFTDYLQLAGDADGPLLSLFEKQELKGLLLRECVYYTHDILFFWLYFAKVLSPKTAEYAAQVKKLRALYGQAKKDLPQGEYFFVNESAVILHECLQKRFEMTQSLYEAYDTAAQVQFENDSQFKKYMDKCCVLVESHAADMQPALHFAEKMHTVLGLDTISIYSIKQSLNTIDKLSAFFKYLKNGSRPLPTFAALSLYFVNKAKSTFFIPRSEEWLNNDFETSAMFEPTAMFGVMFDKKETERRIAMADMGNFHY